MRLYELCEILKIFLCLIFHKVSIPLDYIADCDISSQIYSLLDCVKIWETLASYRCFDVECLRSDKEVSV